MKRKTAKEILAASFQELAADKTEGVYEMDMSLLERVNPIYNTAKMTLCGLAQAVTEILKRTGFDQIFSM